MFLTFGPIARKVRTVPYPGLLAAWLATARTALLAWRVVGGVWGCTPHVHEGWVAWLAGGPLGAARTLVNVHNSCQVRDPSRGP